MAKRNRTIYEDGMTTVEEMAVDTNEISPQSNTGTNVIGVGDVLDTMTGYTSSRFGLVDDTEGSGECVICGAKTAFKMRKICVDCMEAQGQKIYRKTKEAIERGESNIIL